MPSESLPIQIFAPAHKCPRLPLKPLPNACAHVLHSSRLRAAAQHTRHAKTSLLLVDAARHGRHRRLAGLAANTFFEGTASRSGLRRLALDRRRLRQQTGARSVWPPCPPACLLTFLPTPCSKPNPCRSLNRGHWLRGSAVFGPLAGRRLDLGSLAPQTQGVASASRLSIGWQDDDVC